MKENKNFKASYLSNSELLIEIIGDLIIDSFDNIIEFLESITNKNNIKNVYIDLKKVKYIDSSGISFLITSNNILSDTKKSMHIVKPSESVLNILKLTKIDKVLPVFSDINEAKKYKNKSKNFTEKNFKQYEITIPSDFEYIKFAKNFILNIIQKHFEVDNKTIIDIQLSLEEIVINSIEHGYKDADKTGNLQIWALIIDEYIIVGVNDYGQGFDPKKLIEHIKKVDKNPFLERGRGVFIVKALMDEILFDSKLDKYSVFYFTKTLKRKD